MRDRMKVPALCINDVDMGVDMGVIVCAGMIIALNHRSQIVALIWMIVGFGLYFGYGKVHSKLNDAVERLVRS